MANQPSKYSKFLVGAASAALVASAVAPVASAADFKDTKGNTHEEAINALSDSGIIKGYSDGTFLPNKTLSRSDVVKMMGKWLVTEGATIPEDARTNPRFTDLTTKTNGELLDYAAVVKDAGVFLGNDGKLLAVDNITRENMALVLVRAFDTVNEIDLVEYVNAQEFTKDVKDLSSAKKEAQAAINVLDFFNITNPAVASFNPKGSTTRGHFATFLNKSINTDFSVVSVGTANVKAVNTTTVEVTFEEKVENLNSLNFTIDGLTVSNAAVKQTNDKVVVLTTSAQEGGKKYEVKLNDKAIGSFEGISAVIPTSIALNVSNTQAKVGNQVTLSANIGVKAAGVPVTFNVDAPVGSLNKDQVFEVVTNAEGIASFSYTQYAPDADDITAYPTGAPQLRAFGTVYWGITDILTIAEEDKVGNALANGTKKTYTVTYKDPKTGAALANRELNVSFEENTNVDFNAISKATVTNPASGVTVTPYQTKSNLKEAITIKTDSNGQARFIVSGTNTAVTPYVFVDGSSAVVGTQIVIGTNGIAQNTNENQRWEATELTAKAAKVVFEGAQLANDIKVERDGEEEAAAKYGDKVNGRDYKVTILNKDGKPYANGLVNVGLDEVMDRILTTNSSAQFLASDSVKVTGQQAQIRLDKDGKATFTLYGAKGEVGTPVVWIDQNNAENRQAGVLEEGEPFFKAAVSNFQFERVVGAKFTVEGEEKDQNVSPDGVADYAFALTNQSKKVLDRLQGKMTFEVRNTSGEPILVNVPTTGVTYKKQDGTPVTNDGVSNRIEEYGSFTITADVTSQADAKLTVVTATDRKAATVLVTPSFVAVNNFDASADNGITADVRDSYKFVSATGLTATFGFADGIPNFVANAEVEWANVSKETMKLKGHSGTINYSKASYYVQNGIIGIAPALEYTKVPVDEFEKYISENDVVTFTKGTDGAHVIRIEKNNVGKNDGTVTPTTKTGTIVFNSATYDATLPAAITLVDADLNINPAVAETHVVTVKDSTDKGIVVTLVESGVNTGIFTATVSQSQLATLAEGSISVTYNDASDATGKPAVVTATATLKAVEGEEVLTFGSLNADNKIMPDGLGAKMAAFSLEQLNEDLKGSSYEIVVKGITYKFEQSELDENEYFATLPIELTDDEIKAGEFKVTK